MKKLLVISQWGWPPKTNAQILRLVKLIEHLPEHGWEPIVVARETKKYDTKDPELAEEVQGIKCYFYRGFLPDRARIREVLEWFFIPDVFLMDLIANLPKIEKIINKEKPDFILAETPPSGIVIGSLLGEKYAIKTALGYADPWTLNYYYRPLTSIHHVFFSKLEKNIFDSSNIIIGASYMQLEEMKKSFGSEREVVWLPNGFDEKEFSEKTGKKDFEKAVFLYVGTIYRYFDLYFLKIFREVWEENPDLRERFIVRFIGKIAPSKELEIRKIGEKFVEIKGRVSAEELIKERTNVDVNILSLSYEFSQKTFSSRITQFARTGRPTMVFANRDSIAGEVLLKAGVGFVFEKSDIKRAKEFIIKAIEGKINVKPNMEYIMQFEWSNIAKKLAEVLEEVDNE